MPAKNQAITVGYYAWNSSTGAGQTGDVGNHTLKLLQDGTEAAPTNSPAQIDSVNCPGWYSLALTAGDMNYNCVVVMGKSSTSNVSLFGPTLPTDRGVLPSTACTTNASLLTSGTGTDQLSVSAGKVLLQATQTGVTIPTVTTVTNQLSAAAIATGVWQDTTSSDFTTASSIGKSLYTGVAPGAANGVFIAGTNAATTITGSLTTTFTGNLTGSVGGSSVIVTANVTQWNSTSVSTPATAGIPDVNVKNYNNVVAATDVNNYPKVDVVDIAGTASAGAAGFMGVDWNHINAPTTTVNLSGTTISASQVAASVTAPVTLTLTQALNVGRAVDTVADTSLTLNDALQCAVASVSAQVDASSGTSCVWKTASTGTTLRTKTLTLISPPSTVPDKAV